MSDVNSTTNVTRPTTPVLRIIRIQRSELVSINAVMTTFFPLGSIARCGMAHAIAKTTMTSPIGAQSGRLAAHRCHGVEAFPDTWVMRHHTLNLPGLLAHQGHQTGDEDEVGVRIVTHRLCRTAYD